MEPNKSVLAFENTYTTADNFFSTSVYEFKKITPFLKYVHIFFDYITSRVKNVKTFFLFFKLLTLNFLNT